MLKAIGKFIDTLPLRTLFSQEERCADTIVIETDRYYNGYDLAGYTFLMRGVTPSGGETEQMLEKTVLEDTIRLSWTVAPPFTCEAGTLALDLAAYQYADGADPSTDPPAVLVRFQLPPVEVRPLPDCDHTLDTQSYTVFLLQVRSEAEAAITEMENVRDSFLSSLDQYNARLLICEGKLAALTPISIMTWAEYEALDPKRPGTLYVLT